MSKGTLTPADKLDAVLTYLASPPATAGEQVQYIYQYLIEHYPSLKEQNDFAKETYLILEKLFKESFVNLVKSEGSYSRYEISFEGKIFIQQGGYKQQAINAALQNNRVKSLEHFQKVNARRMTYLTIAIAVGTTVAAVYYAIEVLKYLGLIHH